MQASADASRQTIAIAVVMIVASVVVLTGLLGSVQSQWMRRRFLALADVHGWYAESKLGPYPRRQSFASDEAFSDAKGRYESGYEQLREAFQKAYVESLSVHVPFFEFSFDVNDLGPLGGIGLLSVLTCYWFLLAREIDNLRMGFEEARRLGKDGFEEFYKLSAMRQFFTVPETKHGGRRSLRAAVPKLLTWLPFMIYLAVVVDSLNLPVLWESRVSLLLASELLTLVFLAVLCSSITLQLFRIDRLWESSWRNLESWNLRS